MDNAVETLKIESRKRVIGKAGLIFFVIVLLLTFFSNTINNFLVPEVEYKQPSGGRIEKSIEATGDVKALGVENIYSYGVWNILDVKVEQGAEVKKGAVLAIIDKKDIQLELKRMELEIIRAENEFQRYKESFYNDDLTRYDEAVADALKKIEKAEEKLNSVKKLYESGAEPLKSVTDAEDQLEEEKKNYNEKLRAAREKADEIAKNAVEYDRTIKQKAAELELKRLEFDAIKDKLPRDGEIRSPIEGTVTLVNADKGMNSTNGQTLFKITDKNSSVTISWMLNPSKASEMKVGEEVQFEVNYPERTEFAGKIKDKSYMIKEGMYLFTSNVKVDDVDLNEGQEVTVTYVKKSVDYNTIVPSSSLVKSAGEDCVFVLKEREGALGKEYYVQKVKVNVEESGDISTAITGAISSEDNIIIYTTKALDDGIQVKPR